MNCKGEGGLVEEALTHSINGAFYDVHRGLGIGFREYWQSRLRLTALPYSQV